MSMLFALLSLFALAVSLQASRRAAAAAASEVRTSQNVHMLAHDRLGALYRMNREQEYMRALVACRWWQSPPTYPLPTEQPR